MDERANLILQNSLDGGKYVLTVVRIEPYLGHLVLTRDDSVVFEKQVDVAYNAPFGPDVDDVRTWYKLAIEAADEDYRRRGKSRDRERG